MAELSAQERLDGAGQCMREERSPFGTLTKADIRAAFNAIDAFMNANAATLNAAIPQPARAQLTTAQKARLLNEVVRRRYIAGA